MNNIDGIVERNAHLVKRVAWSVSASAAHDEDALQCGLIGLWEAAKRWDGKRPFEPLARRCILICIFPLYRAFYKRLDK